VPVLCFFQIRTPDKIARPKPTLTNGIRIIFIGDIDCPLTVPDGSIVSATGLSPLPLESESTSPESDAIDGVGVFVGVGVCVGVGVDEDVGVGVHVEVGIGVDVGVGSGSLIVTGRAELVDQVTDA
jgi:hypothetical protein